MNQYPIWIGMVVALVMVCVTSNPVWWMIAALGAGANGIVCAANGWKMPVRGSFEETIRHVPMIASTRHKWLADVIPTGLGKASVGDFLLAAGILGAWATRDQFPYAKLVAVLGLVWWASGWAKGFRLFDKWTAEARRDSQKNIPIVLLLMIIGSLFHVRGCGISELRASAKNVESAIASPPEAKVSIKPEHKWRDLGTLAAKAVQLRGHLVIGSPTEHAIGEILPNVNADDTPTKQPFRVVKPTNRDDFVEQLRVLGLSGLGIPGGGWPHYYVVETD